MTRVAVNGRFLGLKITGVERYAREVWSRFPKEESRIIEPRAALMGWRGILWEQAALPHMIRKDELLLSLTNLGPLSKRRQVLVVHDLATLDHPEWFSVGVRETYDVLLPRLVRRVDAIVTVSEFSRQRVIERLSVPEDRVVRIYPGCGSGFHADGKLATKAPYVLAYGSDDPRKNFSRLLNAWTILRREFPDLTLKVFGRPTRLFANTAKGDFENVEFLGYVAEAQLPALYRNASLLAYPSLYEGFGLPILEALASGTQVVVSDIEVFRELFDGSVSFIDPLSVESVAQGIKAALLNPRPSIELRDAGLLSRFNFDRTALQLYELCSTL